MLEGSTEEIIAKLIELLEGQRRAEIMADICIYRTQRTRGRRFGPGTGRSGQKIDAGAAVTAIVTGSGADLDKVADEAAAFTPRSGRFSNDALAYPNAEVVRKLLVNMLPADAIVLMPHDTFGMDLGPGCPSSWIRPSWPTWWTSKGWTATLKVVRQEYSAGMVSTHVTATCPPVR
jgi:hypothetical protein